MIHRVSCRAADEEHLCAAPPPVSAPPPPEFNYNDVIVKKPWGYEYLIYENDCVAIWMLQIVRKRKTSMHSHPRKTTGLVLLHGNATFSHLGGSIDLDALDGVVIEKGVFHCTEASNMLPVNPQSENGIWVMEIESPPMKTDLVRMKDAYGRAGAAYEGLNQMVFDPKECFVFCSPAKGEVVTKKFLNCLFSVRRGPFDGRDNLPAPDALVSIIGGNGGAETNNPYLRVGELTRFADFAANTREEDLEDRTILTIEKLPALVKVSDYIFSALAEKGVKEVFSVCGGGAMHLVDSLGGSDKLTYVAAHHEQAAAMAAEGYARISNNLGVALVTSGPGGTNAITGVCGAWIDSIPTAFISGQVTANTLIGDTGLRQFGIQESNIVDLVKPITKYAVCVTDPALIKYHLEKAIYLATSGRPGPVWLDIPLDVQSRMVNLEELISFTPPQKAQDPSPRLKKQAAQALRMLKEARRPVLISGYGIRLAKGEEIFRRLAGLLGIPVISSWTSSDLLSYDHECYIGRSGIMGDRAGNFTVQNADLLLIIGSRMSIPQVGYNYSTFAREARKIMVDIDPRELRKPSLEIDLPVRADAAVFMKELYEQLKQDNYLPGAGEWLKRCRRWKKTYPVALPEYKEEKERVNSFYFVDLLSQKLDKNALVVTDMGTSFTCTMQTFKPRLGQRLFTSGGHASMGFGLPGAIGACFANNRRKTICISGDGGLQMNIQELQTLVHYNLPMILFVLNNGGYLTIKLMQQNHFGRYVGSEKDSGLSCPDMMKVAAAYGIPALRVYNQRELEERLDGVLAGEGPFICEIMMAENQPLIPRVSSLKKPDGTIISKPLEDLYPFLGRQEFMDNMVIDPVEVLKE